MAALPGGSSVKVGRLFGIQIRMHYTFPLLLALVVLAYRTSGWRAVVAGVIWVAAVFACVVVHELSHCLVARRRGAVVKGILLLPIGGVSQLERMPEDPGDELAIAAVGPLTSLAIGTAFLLVGAVAGSRVWPPTLFAGSWWARLGWLNLLLGAFNLLPALPMDGGRILRALLERHRSRREATRLAAAVARMLAVVMIAVGFVYDFWLLLIGVFVLLGASAEEYAAGDQNHLSPPH